MEPDHEAIARPRQGWEAIDLGFAMVRAWWRPVFVPWLAVAIPARILIAGAFYRRPDIGNWLAWWLRPLFDCVALFLVERCFLSAPAGVAATWRALPRLVRIDPLGLLVAHRLDPSRSFHLPLALVEGLRGRERNQRTVWLHHEGGAATATGLTAACLALEAGTAVALAFLVELVLPGNSRSVESLLMLLRGEGSGAGQPTGIALSITAFCLIEPFYVAAGYSLYLSRRAWLEGWDVQLAFRRMAARLEARSRGGRRAGRAAALLPWLLAGSAALCAPAVVSGAAGPGELTRPSAAAGLSDAPGESPEHAIREVLRDEDFQTRRRISTWKLRDGLLPRLPRIRIPGLGLVVLAVRWALLALAVLLAAGLTAWLVRTALRRRAGPASPRPPMPAGSEVLTGRARAEPLPDDVPAAARAFWEQGEEVAALGLLYRGALAAAVRRDRAPVAASWTEEDCLRSLPPLLGRESGDYLARLIRAWQAAAYARRPPPSEEALTLCGQWSRHFGEPA